MSTSEYRILQDSQIEKAIAYIQPSYQTGSRDDLVFGLGGLLFKNKVSISSARRLLSLLCDVCHDEEKNSRLQVLASTYSKGIEGLEIKGVIFRLEIKG